jgi:hypothetical protein
MSNLRASQFQVRVNRSLLGWGRHDEGKGGWNEAFWEMWFCFRGFCGLNFKALKVLVERLALGSHSLPTDT